VFFGRHQLFIIWGNGSSINNAINSFLFGTGSGGGGKFEQVRAQRQMANEILGEQLYPDRGVYDMGRDFAGMMPVIGAVVSLEAATNSDNDPATRWVHAGMLALGVATPIASIAKSVPNGGIIKSSTTDKGHARIDYLFNNRNDAMNWGAQMLGKNKWRTYDSNGKWNGWANASGARVYWGHNDWYKGKGASTFPHLNYEIGNTKGHLFLLDKIRNAGLMSEFIIFFRL